MVQAGFRAFTWAEQRLYLAEEDRRQYWRLVEAVALEGLGPSPLDHRPSSSPTSARGTAGGGGSMHFARSWASADAQFLASQHPMGSLSAWVDLDEPCATTKPRCRTLPGPRQLQPPQGPVPPPQPRLELGTRLQDNPPLFFGSISAPRPWPQASTNTRAATTIPAPAGGRYVAGGATQALGGPPRSGWRRCPESS